VDVLAHLFEEKELRGLSDLRLNLKSSMKFLNLP
jgi:hypothetical protein